MSEAEEQHGEAEALRWGAPLLALLLLGAVLRLTGLGVHSLWFDEAMTLHHASAPNLAVTLAADRHPPLSFLLFRLWRPLAGSSEAALRLLPALVSCLALALFAQLARRTLARRAALAAIALFAVAPFHVWYGQEVRSYAFVEATVLVALLGALGAGGPRWRGALLAVFLGVGLSVGLHYMGGLVVCTVVALAVAGRVGGELSGRRALAVSAAGVAGVVAWTPFFVAFVPAQLATVWGFTARLTPRDLAELPVRLLLVELDVIPSRFEPLGWGLGGLLLFGMLAGAAGALRPAGRGARIALICLLAPIAGAAVAMVVLPPSLVARYVIAAAPGAALLAGAGLAGFGHRRVPGAVAVSAAFTGCLAITLLHKAGNHREDFRSAVAEVVAAWEPGDRLFVATGVPAGFAESPVVYYLRDEPDVLAGLSTWDEAAAWAGRLHVIHRRARYAEAEVAFLRENRVLVDESPVRFRVQRLLFTSP